MQLLGRATRIGENHVNSLTNQAFDNGIRALHFAADFGLGECCGRGRGFHRLMVNRNEGLSKTKEPFTGKLQNGFEDSLNRVESIRRIDWRRRRRGRQFKSCLDFFSSAILWDDQDETLST